jgi:hypothetical protein
MTAPVVGSGAWPAWTQRVAKSSRFERIIGARSGIVDEVDTGGETEEARPLHDDGDEVAPEQGHEIAHRRVGRDGLEPRRHHVLDRPSEGVGCPGRIGHERCQHVAFIYQADDLLAVDDRQLRDIGGAHAPECGTQRIAWAQHHGRAFGIVRHHHIAYSPMQLAVIPSLLGHEGRIEYLGEVFGAGIADEADHPLGPILRLAVAQCRRQQGAGG